LSNVELDALGGLIALAAHGGKIAVRVAVTSSPEPISNISLSFGEDALAIFLTWFATRHPYSAAAIVIGMLAIIYPDPLGSTLREGIVPWCGTRVSILIDSASVHVHRSALSSVEGPRPVGTIPYFKSRSC